MSKNDYSPILMKVVAEKENEVYFTIHFKYHIQTIYKNLLS